MARKGLWIVFALLAIAVGLYPVLYFLINKKFGLLATKTDGLLANVFWNIVFYTHIILGGLALLIGWLQFIPKIRIKRPLVHRQVGKVYVVSVFLSAPAGVGIGFFATGGAATALGFISLGIIWFYTTLLAYTSIRKGKTGLHQKMMIYSYAACFAAVTLRIWLPLFINIFESFEIAYAIVAWLCWIPNMIVARFIAAGIRT